MVVVMLMVFAADALLLLAVEMLLGGDVNPGRLLLGSLLGTILAAVGMLPGLAFLRNVFFRIWSLVLSALTAFGFRRKTLWKTLIFVLLQTSVGGVLQTAKLQSALLGAAGIVLACMAAGREKDFIPVELTYGGKTLTITALRDTGNRLTDPITGKQVLVVGADVAGKLTGLSPSALHDPIGTLGMLPGLRLIPYRAVGNSGFLLALKIPDVKIGNRQGSALVAFSPMVLENGYQALTGGTV